MAGFEEEMEEFAKELEKELGNLENAIEFVE